MDDKNRPMTALAHPLPDAIAAAAAEHDRHLREVRAEAKIPPCIDDKLLGAILSHVAQQNVGGFMDTRVSAVRIEGAGGDHWSAELDVECAGIGYTVYVTLDGNRYEIGPMLRVPPRWAKTLGRARRPTEWERQVLGEYQPAQPHAESARAYEERKLIQIAACQVGQGWHAGRAGRCDGLDFVHDHMKPDGTHMVACPGCGWKTSVSEELALRQFISAELYKRIISGGLSNPGAQQRTLAAVNERIGALMYEIAKQGRIATVETATHEDLDRLAGLVNVKREEIRAVAPGLWAEQTGSLAEALAKIARLGQQLGEARADLAKANADWQQVVAVAERRLDEVQRAKRLEAAAVAHARELVDQKAALRDELSCWKGDPLLQATAAWSRAVRDLDDNGVSAERTKAIVDARDRFIEIAQERGDSWRFAYYGAMDLGWSLFKLGQDLAGRRREERRLDLQRTHVAPSETGAPIPREEWAAELAAKLRARAAARANPVACQGDDSDDVGADVIDQAPAIR
jgi:hypothetical protein